MCVAMHVQSDKCEPTFPKMIAKPRITFSRFLSILISLHLGRFLPSVSSFSLTKPDEVASLPRGNPRVFNRIQLAGIKRAKEAGSKRTMKK